MIVKSYFEIDYYQRLELSTFLAVAVLLWSTIRFTIKRCEVVYVNNAKQFNMEELYSLIHKGLSFIDLCRYLNVLSKDIHNLIVT